ncbi:hypothetical protein NBRC116598_21100 [Pseudophaeobacter arcticus]|uniref:Uncharacterized protein n=1 Tax=Pseudophaeobacter arcticus TaxID=385492 RepID=A0ABQ0ALB4_9RHOB
MTVCVAVKVHDCIVFAADSAATLSTVDENGNRQILNVYNNADKVFNLHRKLPLVAMTCGMGHICGRSISNLAKEMRKEMMDALDEESYSVKSVAEFAHAFIEAKYSDPTATKTPTDFLEFWVGGYGHNKEHGEIWKIVIQDGSLQPIVQVNQPGEPDGIFWGGQGEAIARLALGVDPSLISVLVSNGMEAGLAAQVFNTGRNNLQTGLVHATMPTIDAIRLAKFLVSTTIDYFSLKFGSDIVGGATDIATVTKYEGFKWIERKHYYPDGLNRETNGHVC